MLDILTHICEGKGELSDLDLLEELAYVTAEASLCELGKTAPNPVLSTLKYFRDEYLAHIVDKRCPAGVCTELIKYEIITDKCKSCGLCVKVCPVDAISGKPKTPYLIHQNKCIKCGNCKVKCPFDAIYVE